MKVISLGSTLCSLFYALGTLSYLPTLLFLPRYSAISQYVQMYIVDNVDIIIEVWYRSIMTQQTISIKETRNQLSRLVEEVAIAKRQFLITKFGKPRALLSPLPASFMQKKSGTGLKASFGAWKHRTDIQDSSKWAANLRHKMSTRYGKIPG